MHSFQPEQYPLILRKEGRLNVIFVLVDQIYLKSGKKRPDSLYHLEYTAAFFVSLSGMASRYKYCQGFCAERQGTYPGSFYPGKF